MGRLLRSGLTSVTTLWSFCGGEVRLAQARCDGCGGSVGLCTQAQTRGADWPPGDAIWRAIRLAVEPSDFPKRKQGRDECFDSLLLRAYSI